MRHGIVILALVLATGTASAQPAAALGKPLPSADLPIGTVRVRVIDGSVASPHPGIGVWLSVDGIARSATSDAAGVATFAGLAVGATVIAAITVAGAKVASDSFVVPSAGGIRVMLSTGPMTSTGPSPRTLSGRARAIDGSALGTIEVNVTSDTVAEAKIAVTLVGYRADDTVSVATKSTSAGGGATFTGLDHSGAVAYYVLATVPRAGAADRLMAEPIVLDDTAGVRVALAADARTAKTPPIDDLEGAMPAKLRLDVELDGVADPRAPIRVIDAATGKVVATGATTDKAASLTLARAGQVLYADATVAGKHYRSRPFLTVADRGAKIAVHVFPRVILAFSMIAEPDGPDVVTWGQFRLSNNAWIPYAGPTAIPLPRGFARPLFAEGDDRLATFTPTGIAMTRPLPPGAVVVRARFDLVAGADAKVRWDLDLPYGSWQSGFRIAKEPGVAIVGAKLPVEPEIVDGESVLTIRDITILPNQSMAMTIELPKLTAGQIAVARACRPLDPDRKTALRGKPMPDFTAPQLDGKPLKLSSLKGAPIVVHFMASWDMLTPKELPTLVKVAGAATIVLVASDGDPAAVAAKLGPPNDHAPFRVVLDPGGKDPKDNIGPITKSWGTHLLPESYVVDKHGIVRLYFANSRDWSTPDALACLQAIARD